MGKPRAHNYDACLTKSGCSGIPCIMCAAFEFLLVFVRNTLGRRGRPECTCMPAGDGKAICQDIVQAVPTLPSAKAIAPIRRFQVFVAQKNRVLQAASIESTVQFNYAALESVYLIARV